MTLKQSTSGIRFRRRKVAVRTFPRIKIAATVKSDPSEVVSIHTITTDDEAAPACASADKKIAPSNNGKKCNSALIVTPSKVSPITKNGNNNTNVKADTSKTAADLRSPITPINEPKTDFSLTGMKRNGAKMSSAIVSSQAPPFSSGDGSLEMCRNSDDNSSKKQRVSAVSPSSVVASSKQIENLPRPEENNNDILVDECGLSESIALLRRATIISKTWKADPDPTGTLEKAVNDLESSGSHFLRLDEYTGKYMLVNDTNIALKMAALQSCVEKILDRAGKTMVAKLDEVEVVTQRSSAAALEGDLSRQTVTSSSNGSKLANPCNVAAKKTNHKKTTKERRAEQNGARIKTVHDNDVLFGRGGGIAKHPGNVYFRNVVRSEHKGYTKAYRHNKAHIANKIIKMVHNQTPPGRFLEMQQGSLWTVVPYQKVLEKTCQALREKKWLATLQQNQASPALKGRGQTKEEKTNGRATSSTTQSQKTSPLKGVNIGSRISIYWPLDDCYYPALVENQLETSFFIRYDDGMTEVSTQFR